MTTRWSAPEGGLAEALRRAAEPDAPLTDDEADAAGDPRCEHGVSVYRVPGCQSCEDEGSDE